MIHITTADSGDGHEIFTPREIAQGYGDEYLIRLNRLFWAKKMRAYVRPLGEPNRCINVYAAYDCEGRLRDSAHTPFWYRRAFQRIYILLHGGGKRAKIDARLAEAGLPPLQPEVIGLPRSPISVLWSTLPAGSPTVPQNRPRYFYPGNAYVDWVGTDFYSDNQDWKSLNGLYHRFSKKPFAIPEFGVSSGDDPRYIQQLLTWVKHHARCQMLIYYQDFGSSNPYRIQNYPASLAMLDTADPHLAVPRLPARSPDAPAASGRRRRTCPALGTASGPVDEDDVVGVAGEVVDQPPQRRRPAAAPGSGRASSARASPRSTWRKDGGSARCRGGGGRPLTTSTSETGTGAVAPVLPLRLALRPVRCRRTAVRPPLPRPRSPGAAPSAAARSPSRCCASLRAAGPAGSRRRRRTRASRDEGGAEPRSRAGPLRGAAIPAAPTIASGISAGSRLRPSTKSWPRAAKSSASATAPAPIAKRDPGTAPLARPAAQQQQARPRRRKARSGSGRA